MDFFEWRASRGESADPESERYASLVIGAAIEVHRHLGPGRSEAGYAKAMAHELTLRQIPFRREVCFDVGYKGVVVEQGRIDLLAGELVIVELKSVERLCDLHRSQLLAYLVAKKLRLGLLINFNVPILRQGIKRVVRDFDCPS